MLTLLVFLPCLSALLVLVAGRFLGRHGASYLTITVMGLACFHAWITFLNSMRAETFMYMTGFTWIQTATNTITFDLYFDNITLAMFVVVTTIAFIVHWYSYDYMYNDPHLPRFMMYLSFFTFFMLLLISAADFTILFIGWEGVGLLSYLLINFWYTRIQANKSALKAIFVNKIGDIAMLGAIALFYLMSGTTNIITIAALAPYLQDFTLYNFSLYNVALCCFVIGAVGKSAQLFLHVWLPDAMEGPTPVSALLHAATMVTAGVFLIVRNSSLFELAPDILFLILSMGTITTFFAATTGLVQYDLKRIIAFSTCSQLGYMFAACGVSGYAVSLFHLFNHAFFKALLFLAAGSIIHALADEQDIRRMGALAFYLPLTFSFFCVASLSLMGVPFLSGFYSKDLIIELQAGTYVQFSSFFFLLLVTSAVLTAFYSARLVFFVFLDKPHFNHTLLHDAGIWVQVPLLCLAILSIVSGFYFEDLFVGVGSTYFSGSIFILPQHWHALQFEYIPYVYSQLPLIGSLFGVGVSTFLFFKKRRYSKYKYVYYCLTRFLVTRWGFDVVYNNILVRGFTVLLFHFYYFLDKGLIELVGPTGLYVFFTKGSLFLVRSQTGALSEYIRLLAIGFVVIVVSFPFVVNFV